MNIKLWHDRIVAEGRAARLAGIEWDECPYQSQQYDVMVQAASNAWFEGWLEQNNKLARVAR
jgi:hypothetical protein